MENNMIGKQRLVYKNLPDLRIRLTEMLVNVKKDRLTHEEAGLRLRRIQKEIEHLLGGEGHRRGPYRNGRISARSIGRRNKNKLKTNE